MDKTVGPSIIIIGLVFFNMFIVLYATDIFVREPSDQQVTLLEETKQKQVQFECESNLEVISYQWLKDGVNISNKDDRYNCINGTLTINPVQVSDAGNYRCLAISQYGSALSNIGKLTITYIHKFEPREKKLYETEAGKGIAIPCEFANYAPENSVFFFWEAIDAFIFYGNPGSTDYYVSQNDGTLYFANPTTELTDKYYCFIRYKWNLPSGRRIEQSSLYIDLEIEESRIYIPPNITLNPKNVTYAKFGSSVMLECFAGGNPTPTLKWTKINGSLPSNHVITDAGQLELHDITHDVNGTYRCTASSKKGNVTTQGDVIVSETPSFKRRVFSKKADFHKTTSFWCEASGIPPPTYKWLKNGAPIEMTSHVSVSVGTEGGSVMTITEVGDDDVAIYQCVAENPLGSLTSNTKLNIKDSPLHTVSGLELKILKLAGNSHNKSMIGGLVSKIPVEAMIAFVGCDVEIQFTVEGYPVPHINWWQNDLETGNTANISFLGSSIVGHLYIQNISPTHIGNYTANASNGIEIVNRTRQLMVYDLPSPPINVDVISSTNTSQLLTWNTQSSDVIKYKVEGRLSQEDDWFSFDCDVNKPCFASNLLPYNEYVYRVYSINKYGMSNASEISKPQRTKGGAPSITPTGVTVKLENGELLIDWNVTPSTFYGSKKVIYTAAYRYWYKTTELQSSEWFMQNVTQSNATSTSFKIIKSKNVFWYEGKVKICNEFGQSSFSEEKRIIVAKTQEEVPAWVLVISVFAIFVILTAIVMGVWYVRRRKFAKKKAKEASEETQLKLLRIISAETERDHEIIFDAEDEHPLLQHYLASVKEERFEEANCVAGELQQEVEGIATAWELWVLARKFRIQKKYIMSLLYLQLSSALYATDPDADIAVKGIELCAEGMMLTNKQMLEGNYTTMKAVVRDHVIPLMRDMATTIEEKQDGDKITRVLTLVWCLHHFGYSKYLIGDGNGRESTLRKSISLMDETFGLEAFKHKVYAFCLHNLGFVCKNTSRFEEAIKYYEQALEAFKRAEDLDEWDDWTEITQNGLGVCQKKLLSKQSTQDEK